MRSRFGTAAGLIIAFGLVACGGGGGGTGGTGSTGGTGGTGGTGNTGGTGSVAHPVTLTGVVTKGPLRNANVVVYALDSHGNKGDVLGRGQTASDDSGEFQVTLPDAPTGPVLVDASGGDYVAESNAGTVDQTTHCRTVLSDVGDGSQPIAVNPVTDIAASRTIVLLGSGKPATQAVTQARQELVAFFRFDADLLHLLPSFDTADVSAANAEALKLGLLLIALDQFAHDAAPLHPDDVYASFAQDFEDGVLDCDSTVASYGDLEFRSADSREAAFMLSLLRSMHYAVGAVANRVMPSAFAQYANANLANPDVQPDFSPWYGCYTGTELVVDAAGQAVCWDGTIDELGQPYLGTYYVCGTTAYATDPRTCPDGSPTMMYSSTTPAMFHAVTPELFQAQEVKPITAEELEAMRLADMSGPLPSWATPGAALSNEQLSAINSMYSNLQAGWSR